MANTIITKNSATATAVPTAGQLVQGELAVNVTDKRLFTENSGGTVVELGTNPSQVNFADNSKAIFGAGSDLQIYHDGTNSYISDSGQGRLIILSDGAGTRINTSTGEIMAEFVKDAEVSLRYDNSLKLATTATGIDVTGDVVADGLTVEGASAGTFTAATFRNTTGANGTRVQAVLQNVGIACDVNLVSERVGANSGADFIVETSDGSTGLDLQRLRISEIGDISFYEDTGTTPKFFWDASAESLGIGTTVPTSALTVGNTSATASQITITSSATGVSSIYFADADPDVGRINYDHSTNALSFVTANTTKVTIDSTGSVGIGTSSPANMLHLSNTSEGTHDLAFNRNTTYGASTGLGGVSWYNQAGDTKLTRIESQTDGAATNTRLIFSTASSGTLAEKMRITSGGDLLVGTTDSDIPGDSTGSGVVLKASGRVDVTRNGILAYFNRTSSEGDLVEFRKNGAMVGSIGTLTTDLYVGSGDCNLRFRAGQNEMIPATTAGSPSDGLLDLGADNARFKNFYLSGGVYVGGTAAANHLDDYEEGTWTPTISGNGTNFTGTTYAGAAGLYTKVGRTVWVSFDITVSNAGTLNADGATISGIPFSIPNYGDLRNGGGGIGYTTGLQLNYVYQSCYPQNNSSYLYIIGRTAASSTTTAPSANSFYTNSIRISGYAWWNV